ncbi:hypothetical protein [Sulfitobacter sp.]|uniref:hypothetical protein n=1 Tax=Sulfitobacter sp. TaxID=1903071 RepID=UPI003F6AFEEA
MQTNNLVIHAINPGLTFRDQFRLKCMYRLLFANDFWHVLGSRSYVSGLFIDTRVVALLGLRTRRDLISCKVDYDHLGRQTLGA